MKSNTKTLTDTLDETIEIKCDDIRIGITQRILNVNKTIVLNPREAKEYADFIYEWLKEIE